MKVVPLSAGGGSGEPLQGREGLTGPQFRKQGWHRFWRGSQRPAGRRSWRGHYEQAPEPHRGEVKQSMGQSRGGGGGPYAPEGTRDP